MDRNNRVDPLYRMNRIIRMTPASAHIAMTVAHCHAAQLSACSYYGHRFIFNSLNSTHNVYVT